MKQFFKTTALAAGATMALLAHGAGASTILVGATFDKKGGNTSGAFNDPISVTDANDCSGLFGTATSGDAACDVGAYLDPAEDISEWIAKFDFPGGWSGNSDYDTISNDFSEFDLYDATTNSTGASASSGTGNWTYTPGEGDPGVRFWSIKASTSFNLWWYVETADNCTAGLAAGNYSSACLNDAIVTESGVWGSPVSGSISHIVFYNGEPPPPAVIPLPAAGWMLLAGLGGLVAMKRRKKADA